LASPRICRGVTCWIFCINQDDLQDWEEESVKMAEVYGNAYVTITAASALNDKTGFLVPRSEYMYKDFSNEESSGQLISGLSTFRVVALKRRDPLSSRAWTFQERLMSRRTPYYHPQELIFECKQGQRRECMSCSRTAAEKRIRPRVKDYWESVAVYF
jgi:Zn ribbon nucleic-acid-binding protein